MLGEGGAYVCGRCMNYKVIQLTIPWILRIIKSIIKLGIKLGPAVVTLIKTSSTGSQHAADHYPPGLTVGL